MDSDKVAGVTVGGPDGDCVANNERDVGGYELFSFVT